MEPGHPNRNGNPREPIAARRAFLYHSAPRVTAKEREFMPKAHTSAKKTPAKKTQAKKTPAKVTVVKKTVAKSSEPAAKQAAQPAMPAQAAAPVKAAAPAKAAAAKPPVTDAKSAIPAQPATEPVAATPAKAPPARPGKPEQPMWARMNQGHSQKMGKGRLFRHQGR